ncbi:MAG TPA: ribbon-helix-helix domain-containing protein [Micromonosporaceae bacterium]
MSVSLPPEDVSFLDDYVQRRGTPSRSAVLHQAIDLLRHSELEVEYAAAWSEWQTGEAAWDEVAADGLADAPR